MSSAFTASGDTTSEGQVVLSHLVNRLLQREGGNVPVERVTLRVSDYADLSDQQAHRVQERLQKQLGDVS
ncbi:MAG: nitric oxide reductase NorQ protein [Natrialbaceae archaeon]|jgi:nitric oxide reductase NorQ protein